MILSAKIVNKLNNDPYYYSIKCYGLNSEMLRVEFRMQFGEIIWQVEISFTWFILYLIRTDKLCTMNLILSYLFFSIL